LASATWALSSVASDPASCRTPLAVDHYINGNLHNLPIAEDQPVELIEAKRSLIAYRVPGMLCPENTHHRAIIAIWISWQHAFPIDRK
jgi:hypothetical protein